MKNANALEFKSAYRSARINLKTTPYWVDMPFDTVFEKAAAKSIGERVKDDKLSGGRERLDFILWLH